MEENQKNQCTGNCLNCLPAQRAYCASQHAYSNMKVLDNMMMLMIDMQGTIKEIQAKVEAMQNNEALLFDPTVNETVNEPVKTPIAQQGTGALQ